MRPEDDEADTAFARWKRTADPAALGALFDASAPRLLRLAIHLVGDPALSEDLVQGTFLTLIERRDAVDAGRPIGPWLAGVLTRKAGEERRRRARRVDPAEVVARAERSPEEHAIEGELSGELARALDRLAEPYRGVLVLRLRHGLAPADIAHALDRNPATVRVQLHRGLEELRRMLPAGVAGLALLLGTAPRGLAAVREAVLASAAPLAATGVAATWIGGLLVTTKLALAAAALAVLAAAIWVGRERIAEPAPSAPAPGLDASTSSAAAPTVALPGGEEPQPTASMRVAATSPRPAGAAISGEVVDARSGAPLEGARLALFGARRGLLSEAMVALGENVRHQSNGLPWTPGRLPLVVADRDGEPLWDRVAERQDLAPVRVYDAPLPEEVPLAETATSADGAFQLPAPATGGVVVVELGGFARRCFAAPRAEGAWRVELLPAWTLRGVVIDTQGEPVAEPLRLVFAEGSGGVTWSLAGEERSVWQAGWVVETGADGSFAVELGARSVSPGILSSGWVAGRVGLHPEQRSSWVFRTSFGPEQAGETAWVVALGAPRLEVRDAASGAPLEDLRLRAFDSAGPVVPWCGRFHAPGGRVTLATTWQDVEGKDSEGLRVLVGSPGYASAEVLITDRTRGERHVVELVVGGSTLAGLVLDGGRAVGGARVDLIPHRPGWELEERSVLDAARTTADGSFELAAFPGRWVVRASAGERVRARVVDVPLVGSLAIDLADPTGLEVRVVDQAGLPRGGHTLLLLGEEGDRRVRGRTDAAGLASFEGLSAETWLLVAPTVPTEGSFAGGVSEQVELLDGEVRRVELVVPRPDPERRLRLVVEGHPALLGWKARLWDADWIAVEADGTLPADPTSAIPVLEVQAPDGRRWRRQLDGGESVVHLRPQGPGYAGTLRRATDGAPLARLRVHAWSPAGRDGWTLMSALTDERGAFELVGSSAPGWRLWFDPDTDARGGEVRSVAYRGLAFWPEPPPGTPPTRLDIALPLRRLDGAGGLERRDLGGRVVRASGEALEGAMVVFDCRASQRDGWLAVDYGSSLVRTATDGRFTASLPAAERVEVRVLDASGAELHREQWTGALASTEAERLLVVP